MAWLEAESGKHVYAIGLRDGKRVYSVDYDETNGLPNSALTRALSRAMDAHEKNLRKLMTIKYDSPEWRNLWWKITDALKGGC